MYKNNICIVCNSKKNLIFKKKKIIVNFSTKNLKISDKDYGLTLKLYKCSDCNFIFANRSDCNQFYSFYKNMKDYDYIKSESQRYFQLKNLIEIYLKKFKKPQKHLDIGAGSGILTSIMDNKKIDSLGIEPSSYLKVFAQKKKRNVKSIELKSLATKKYKFNLITLIDVIEHVSNPGLILEYCYKLLEKNGNILIVTPNTDSVVAKILNFKWWHYRVAHINYFNLRNLNFFLSKKKFFYLSKFYPSWTFSFNYFFDRVCEYLNFLRIFKKIIYKKNFYIKINFFDSIAVVYKKN
jgi:ubiquinone/menaquinone biosynthesis C-methylase UbiE